MFDKLYKTASGEDRKYGIYAPGIDRFILIDSNDVWVTLQTAELLSSKLPTVAYVLNTSEQNINDTNCINYSILNKSNQRINNVSITVSRQHPKLIFLGPEDTITLAGHPEDYNTDEKQTALTVLREYARYVHKLSYIITVQEAVGNHYNNKTFAEKYFPNEWNKDLYIAGDRTNQYTGVFDKLKHAIYISSTIDELNDAIKNIWIEHVVEQGPMMAKFYEFLGQPIPPELKDKVQFEAVISSLHVI